MWRFASLLRDALYCGDLPHFRSDHGFLFAFTDSFLFREIQFHRAFLIVAIWRIVGDSAFPFFVHVVGGAQNLIALICIFLSDLYFHYA
jgi:hypothetical protein